MSKEKLYETIEAFLDGTLEGEALIAFEKRLEQEEDLVAEVRLHRGIQEELGNPAKRNLRIKLDQLREEFTIGEEDRKVVSIKQNRSWKRLLSIAAGILLLGLLIWLLVPRSISPEEIVSDPAKVKETPKLPSEQIEQQKDSNLIVKESIKSTKEKEKLPVEKKPVVPPAEKAIAKVTPNPFFENLISQNENQRTFDFSLDKPEDTKLYLTSDQKAVFSRSGTLETSNPEKDNQIVVAVFNDESTSSSLSVSLLTFPLRLEKEEEEEEETGFAFGAKTVYYFDFEKKLNLAPGLYYYTFTLETQRSVLYTGKFTVFEK